MKALFVNGSPRRNWNTHKMLESALQGAKEAGAECELVNLYELEPFRGCVSCFACKLKNAKTHGLCAVRDSLTPVLEKALASDVIVVGSPVYLLDATAAARAFMERLVFPAASYSVDEKTGKQVQVLDKPKYTAIIYTMNGTQEAADKFNFDTILGACTFGMRVALGHCEMLCAYNTYQFADYSRYDANMFSEPDKAKYREEHFPDDLKKAYELGRGLVLKAGAQN